LLRQKLFHIADGAGAAQSFSVGVKGRPRLPLNSIFNRRSLELLVRRMISGATRLPISRRNRRPFNQSFQLMEPSIGMQGTFDFEFIGDFFHERFAFIDVTIFRQVRKPPDFIP